MNIKSETHTSWEEKASTDFPKTSIQIKSLAIKWHVSMIHGRAYLGSGQKSGFSCSPRPWMAQKFLTDWGKLSMTQTKISIPPSARSINRRAIGRMRRRIRWGDHFYQKYQGAFQPMLATNAVHFGTARPSNASVVRQDAIASTAGALGAPTSSHNAQGYTTQQ